MAHAKKKPASKKKPSKPAGKPNPKPKKMGY